MTFKERLLLRERSVTQAHGNREGPREPCAGKIAKWTFSMTAYVEQEDIMYDYLTIEETSEVILDPF